MAKLSNLSECPPNAWNSSGFLADFSTTPKQVLDWGEQRNELYDYLRVTTPNDGVVSLAKWTVPRSAEDPTPVEICGILMMRSDRIELSDLIEGLGIHVPGFLSGMWEIFAVADSEESWNPDWESPAVMMMGRAWNSALRGADGETVRYNRPNQLTLGSYLNELPHLRRLVRLLAQFQGTTTVFFHEKYAHDAESMKFFSRLKPSDRGKTLVFSVPNEAAFDLNKVLQSSKVQLDRGGALILPHSPLRSISRNTLSFSEKAVGQNVPMETFRRYMRLPSRVEGNWSIQFPILQRYMHGVASEPEVPAAPIAISGAAVGVEKDLLDKLAEVRADLAQSQARVADLEQAEKDAEELRRQVADLTRKLDADHLRSVAALAVQQLSEAHGENELVAAELDDKVSEVAWLRGKLSELTQHSFTEDVPAVSEDFASWSDLFDAAEERFPDVVIGPVVRAKAQLLADYQQARSWRAKTWKCLETLQCYAETVRELGNRPEVSTLQTYLKWPGARTRIPASAHRGSESLNVISHEKTYRPRVFQVPVSVCADGAVFMGEHIEIGSKSTPSPRLHLFDATKSDGKVYVGYVGPHLLTSLSG